ncbi:MAG TPA: FAD-dependent oxidoreductase [Chloroflexota bacterium]|jgi:succinate dehydrogenase / fumarate reductase flavoprotein subunit
MEDLESRSYDVVVVGAGGAGLWAAVSVAEAGLSCGLVSKSLLGKAHTVMAEGGIAAALGNLDPADGWQQHFVDTMRGGQFLNDWRMVEFFAREAPERVYQLERWGALFDRTPDGKILQRPFGAHTYRRLCHVGDRTGLELIRTLQMKVVHMPVEVLDEVTCTKILKDGDRVSGVLAYRRQTGRFVLLRARAVVLATGGWGKIYKVTSNSWESTGDGAAMAYQAGAELQDMEMVQFHPTGMVWPPGVRGILVTEAVRGDGGILLNSEGERFMERYDPVKKDLSSRDVVARSIYKEVLAGRGSPHGGAFLDITHRGADFIKQKLPNMYDQFLALADVDITKEKFEVGPTIHYVMGGVRVEPGTAATSLPGLYAAGEVASCLHGANRLGGNSLSDLLVFGKRAGDHAAAYVEGLAGEPKVDPAEVGAEMTRVGAPLERERGENPFAVHEALQTTMGELVGISRTEADLKKALAQVLEHQERAGNTRAAGSTVYNPGWHACLDVVNMTTLAETMVRSAIERRESRGAQWRLDYPDKVEQLGKVNFIARRGANGEMEIATAPVPEMPEELADLFKDSK